MMTNEQYSDFRKKLNPIIKACSATKEQYDSTPDKISHYSGVSSYTKDNEYFFDVSVALQYGDELLNICQTLPRLNTVFPGTLCSIASVDLIKSTTNPAIRKSQLEAVEKFMFLLNVNRIAGVRWVKLEDDKTYPIADISKRFSGKI